MARTMSDERERQIFAACENDWLYTEQTYRKWCQSLKSELDAERAAHANTSGTLALLVSELVEACGWGDKTPLHAALHARNAVLNLKADVAAERAAHAETKQRLGAAHKEANITNEELCRDIAALKARLALAEAVCEAGSIEYMCDEPDCGSAACRALAAWRAAK